MKRESERRTVIERKRKEKESNKKRDGKGLGSREGDVNKKRALTTATEDDKTSERIQTRCLQWALALLMVKGGWLW